MLKTFQNQNAHQDNDRITVTIMLIIAHFRQQCSATRMPPQLLCMLGRHFKVYHIYKMSNKFSLIHRLVLLFMHMYLMYFYRFR